MSKSEATINLERSADLASLESGYLFPTVKRKRQEFLDKNPDCSRKIISLGIGDTTHPLPTVISEAMADYCKGLSTPEGICAKGAKKVYKNICPEEIFISDGSKCDIGRLQWLFSKSKIAVQDPAYPVYVDSSVMMGNFNNGEKRTNKDQYPGIIYMPCTRENDFFPDLKGLAMDADVIFFCNPNNPTGACANKKQLELLVKFANDNKKLVVYDAAYATYIDNDGKEVCNDDYRPISIFEIEGSRTCCLETNSFSKSAGFTGVRLGWTVCPRDVLYKTRASDEVVPLHKDWARIMSTVFNGPPSVSQAGGIAVLNNLDSTREIINYYKENARLILKTLKSCGLTSYGGVHSPYIFVYFEGRDSWEVFDEILNKAQVVTTPGGGFGPAGANYVRISSYANREDVVEACKRLEVLFSNK